MNINVRKYFERPFILNVPCIMELNPCSGKQPIEIVTNENPNNDGKDCPCNELREKENDCNCEESSTDPCECKCDDTCHDQNPCCAKIETFVSELFVVKDEVACYKPGEISLIENVMMGETRVKKHRHLQREETYSEREEENNIYNERDTQIDERFSLHKEVDNVVETDLSVDAGANYSSRAGNKKTYKSFSASLDVSFNQSKKDASKIVQDESKNVITRAIEKVEKKVRTLSSRKMINEIEEKNKHSFDGTAFTQHENGIYFFVNQERKAQVYSHGVRKMLDFYVPDPSLRLKSLLEKDFELKKPKKPCLNIENINPDDYLKYIQCYGFRDLEKLPKSTEYVDFVVKGRHEPDNSRKGKGNSGLHTGQTQFVIPDNYEAVSMAFASKSVSWDGSGVSILITVADGEVVVRDGSADTNSDTLSKLTGNQTVNYQAWDAVVYNLVVRVKCVLNSELTLKWQLDVFNRIMDKYNKELEEYDKAFKEFQRNKQNKFNQNPFMLSETIKKQLKHSALEYITCQFFDTKNGMRNKVKPCGLPQMDIPETEEFGKKVRFFEHAFEWKFMSYMLYPYFWAEKCTWEDKLQEEAQNGLFQEFLQSGYARISISIRPGFESLVQYYIEEGEIWEGLGLPSYGDPSYLPIYQEIKESKDNFNTDRDGYLIWDSTFQYPLNTTQASSRPLKKDEIIVRNDLAIVEYFDIASSTTLDQMKVKADKNRVVVIDCIEYRIVDIILVKGEVVLKLDRDLEHKDSTLCPDDFDNRYKDKNILWSTGAKFEGAPWKFIVPTSLTWLKEEECLPCYPVNCKENC